MKLERFVIQTCSSCGNKTTIIFKIDRPISTTLITALVKLGFIESPRFTKAGLLYVDNLDFILTGPIGSDRLQVKCKFKDCDIKLNELEGLLLQME